MAALTGTARISEITGAGLRMVAADTYAESLAAERRIYESCLEVHDLPPIFHYWSQRHLREKLLPLGFGSVSELFKTYLERQCRKGPNEPKRFLSLGAGNCDLELDLAAHLHAAQDGDFVIECVDLNPSMLARGSEAAAAAGLSRYLRFTTGDLNEWRPAAKYHAVIANQSLHHVVNLEGLFAHTKKALLPGGCFVISDMIGRNGHQRWPEAMAIVQEFWRKLPPSYRFNRKLGVYQEMFQDWDCSVEGFEGVRAQDILPLLLQDFHFELFLPFGNAIDPFIDRSFGFHFDAGIEWDRNFIDAVHARDEAEMNAGRIKPTHMLAVVGNERYDAPVLFGHLTPEFCVRTPDLPVDEMASCPAAGPGNAYEWQAWPPDVRPELAATARRFGKALREAKHYGNEVVRLENELLDRTKWALALDRDASHWRAALNTLNGELEERTRWALRMETEFSARTSWALRLSTERDDLEATLEERTRRALVLQHEVEIRTRWALQLASERDAAILRAGGLESELQRTRGFSGALLILRRCLRGLLRYIARAARTPGGRTLRVPAGEFTLSERATRK